MRNLSKLNDKKRSKNKKPLILVLGGHDPSGAGLLADIETCAANSCLALTIVTAVTSQNTSSYEGQIDIDESFLIGQLTLLLKEFTPDAVKIGLIPKATMCMALADYIKKNLSHCPIVLDPVLKTGKTNSNLTDEELPIALKKNMFPLSTVITPNRQELIELGENTNFDEALRETTKLGTKAILVTDVSKDNNTILNILSHSTSENTVEYVMRRYPESSHGTGCTLSSAIACELAKGHSVLQSTALAQLYAHSAVEHSSSYRTQQTIPNRFYRL